ncbi:MAG: pseudouridine synthase [Gloeomargaritaceae cyanobacterium C42_A2020_066]|nr:pseudouridine synthase [Gloeomargaritaceae cyanobacterium C42_A2020_066]
MPYRYLVFHKPYGVLCQFSCPEPGRQTLQDFIPVPGVYPAGRLDQDSEGLLVLTDDGALQHRLTTPKFGHRRTYLAQVEGLPTEAALMSLRQGVVIQDYHTRPAEARLLADPPDLPPRDPPIRYRAAIPTAWLELTLTEGKNRQVRRMTAAVGYPTLRLVRIAFGALTLQGLTPGNWRPLTAAEQRTLLASTPSTRHADRSLQR